jgi:hypothetical protein
MAFSHGTCASGDRSLINFDEFHGRYPAGTSHE